MKVCHFEYVYPRNYSKAEEMVVATDRNALLQQLDELGRKSVDVWLEENDGFSHVDHIVDLYPTFYEYLFDLLDYDLHYHVYKTPHGDRVRFNRNEQGWLRFVCMGDEETITRHVEAYFANERENIAIHEAYIANL